MRIEDYLGQDNIIGIEIWKNKYYHQNETFEDWLNRVSNNDSAIKELIIKKQFLFGGRILANRGLGNLGRKITYSNCYVMTPPEDNIESIFDCAKELARTYSYGGGCGVDLSKLSPNGAKINNAAKESSGAVSFMNLYDVTTATIGQSGRRGALMLSLSCEHPDIEQFIDIKNDLNKVTKANISIRMTDDFMDAVINNRPYTLHFLREQTGEIIKKTVLAKEIFAKIAKNNWNMAEPGMLFWDTINNWNLLTYHKEFEYGGVNPCAEEPLPPGGSCLLGSLNLSEFINKPFTNQASFQTEEFIRAVKTSVNGLNDILDEGLPLHPLKLQQESVGNWRQIGLGIMGLADMLIKLGVTYGSPNSIKVCRSIASTLVDTAIYQSAMLSKEQGPFPKYDFDALMQSDFFLENTSEDTKEAVAAYGMRNSQLLTIAPTGTISTMLGISGGIEPIFATYYNRKTESLHNTEKTYKVYTPITKEYMDKNNISDEKELPEFFVTAQQIHYLKRITMQSIWQQYIDASISSTVNVPEEFSVENVEQLYIEAWRANLKGITIFRNNCDRAGILTFDEAKPQFDHIVPISRKDIGTTHGETYCRKSACGTMYITVNKDINENIVETFVHTSKGGICKAHSDAVSRMVSLAMRSGIKIEEIVDQLAGIHCAGCIKSQSKVDGISCPDIMAKTIKEFAQQEQKIIATHKHPCPECGFDLQMSGGCVICSNCGHSKCQ